MFDEIRDIICQGEKIPFEMLLQRNREQENVYCRQLIMYFARVKKAGSLTFIGNKFGLDHATVIHSVKTIQNYMDVDKAKREQIEQYAKKLNCIKEIYTMKIQLKKLIEPLKNDISLLEQRLINVRLTVDNLMNKIDNIYR